jgi:hypothetical protein
MDEVKRHYKVFERYIDPRLVVYNHPGDEYNLPGGWKCTEKEVLVIGETYDTYVTEIRVCTLPYWDECGRYKATSSIFLGFHKSRFVKWKDRQLELF